MLTGIKITNPRLLRLIAFRRLDRESLIALASQYFFPVELIDRMSEFLETKLLEILIEHNDKLLTIPLDSIDCNCTNNLKVLISQQTPNPIYLTDVFMGEYIDRVSQGLNQKQLKFYDNLLGKINEPTT